MHGDLRPHVALDVGTDLLYRLTTYSVTIPLAIDVRGTGLEDSPSMLITRQFDQLTLGLYGELGWEIGRLRLIPGVRADLYVLAGSGRASLDPRLVARLRLDRKTSLKAYAGIFHQPPQAETLDAEYGNPAIALTSAIHTGVGVERKLGHKLEVDAEAYYVRRRDLTVFGQDSRTYPDGSVRPVYWNSDGIGDTYGLEIIAKREVTQRFYAWLSYTLSYSEMRRHPDEAWAPTAFDQRHNLIGVASYHTEGGWELGLRAQLTTGRPETPILGGTYNADTDAYGQLWGDRHSARETTFAQIDVRVEKTWLLRTWRITAYLDVMNVTNADNPEAIEWDYRFRHSAPVAGLPILPTFGVKGQW